MSKKGNEIAELERQLEALSAEVGTALAEADGLQAGRQSVLVSGTDDDLVKHDADFTAAQRKRERTSAMICDVQGRLVQARANKADADRAAAEAEANEAAAAVCKGYAEIKKIIGGLQGRVSEAGIKLWAVNHDRGDEDEIASVADRVFASRSQPRKVLTDKIVELWVYEKTGHFIPDQNNVTTHAGGRGLFYSESAMGRSPHKVLLKKFHRREFLAERQYFTPTDMLDALRELEDLITLTFKDTRIPEVELIPIRDGAATAAA